MKTPIFIILTLLSSSSIIAKRSSCYISRAQAKLIASSYVGYMCDMNLTNSEEDLRYIISYKSKITVKNCIYTFQSKVLSSMKVQVDGMNGIASIQGSNTCGEK